jgi:hypothetical protein
MHPDTRTCSQLKSCTVTDFWLRDSLYRDTAPVPQQKSCTVIVNRLRFNLYRDTRNAYKICTWMAKTRAIPSLHRDSFLAYRDRFVAVLRRVTQPPHIAGPLCVMRHKSLRQFGGLLNNTYLCR